jgi:hypothetical protein
MTERFRKLVVEPIEQELGKMARKGHDAGEKKVASIAQD